MRAVHKPESMAQSLREVWTSLAQSVRPGSDDGDSGLSRSQWARAHVTGLLGDDRSPIVIRAIPRRAGTTDPPV